MAYFCLAGASALPLIFTGEYLLRLFSWPEPAKYALVSGDLLIQDDFAAVRHVAVALYMISPVRIPLERHY